MQTMTKGSLQFALGTEEGTLYFQICHNPDGSHDLQLFSGGKALRWMVLQVALHVGFWQYEDLAYIPCVRSLEDQNDAVGYLVFNLEDGTFDLNVLPDMEPEGLVERPPAVDAVWVTSARFLMRELGYYYATEQAKLCHGRAKAMFNWVRGVERPWYPVKMVTELVGQRHDDDMNDLVFLDGSRIHLTPDGPLLAITTEMQRVTPVRQIPQADFAAMEAVGQG